MGTVAIMFLAGLVGICPENWPFRWPPRPKGLRDVVVDFLAGLGGVGGGVLAQSVVGAQLANPQVLVATVAVAFVAGGAVRHIATYLGATPQPAVGQLEVRNAA